MKSFYGGTYISKELLEKNRIYHPIRLEYYKIQNEEQSKFTYGIEIVKTEYQKEKTEVEKNHLEYITEDEEEILELLEKFKVGSVTPDFLEEMLKETQVISKKESYW